MIFYDKVWNRNVDGYGMRWYKKEGGAYIANFK